MEPCTSGKVSRFARSRYLADFPGATPDQFRRIKGGYMMYGYASCIDRARAMGRGWTRGGGDTVHAFDMLVTPFTRLRERMYTSE
jgi:hypothetical protein